MFDRIKQHIVKRLMEEISCLDASELELVAENVISYKESKRLIHHGCNKNYKPVKSTIDAFSDDSTIAVECSTDQNYFTDSSTKGATLPLFSKIDNDVSHAVRHKPPNGPDKIYLITNQEEQPSFRSQFNTTTVFSKYGSKITIYDSRELAKFIYEQAKENNDVFSFYRQAFPDFAANMDNYEYYGKVPSLCDNHIETPEIVGLIAKHFDDGNAVCVLHGISGSGKTQSVIQYVHKTKDEYDNILWIGGEDWKCDTPLSSIHRTRGGAPINISGIFNTQKTLLVIDSLERIVGDSIFSELGPGFSKTGRVLVTSQVASVDKKYLAIPNYSSSVAMSILGETEQTISGHGKKILALCSSIPLILSIICNLVEKEEVSREVLYKEILDNPENITDDGGKSIVGQILSNLEPNILGAFTRVANTGSAYHDSEFLVHFIGGLNRSALQKISLLLPANAPGIVRAHDLLISSVQDEHANNEISFGIESYLDKNKGEMTPSILREIYLCYKQLCAENKRRGARTPDWITYALIQIEDDTKQEICDEINSLELTADLSLSAIMSIIDAKETFAYSLNGDARGEFYKKCSIEYQKAYEVATNDDIRLEYLHHRGKALRRCNEYEDALSAFHLILKERPDWHAALGQLAHLGAQKKVPKKIKNAGEEAIKKLLEHILNDNSKVPLRVSLAMFARLRSYRNVSKEISRNKEQVAKLAELIAVSGLEGFGQFYEAYVSFTSMFGYEYGDITLNLTEQIPAIFMQTPSSVEKSQWLSACESLVNTATAAKYSGKPELFEKLKDAALQFADRLSESSELKNYEGRALAKAYLVPGRKDKDPQLAGIGSVFKK